jgi:DNA-binding XRE family transcriptional regulator
MALKIKQAILNHYEKTGEWITQVELAKKTDVNPKTIWELEKKPNKSIDTLFKIAEVFGCKVEELRGLIIPRNLIKSIKS